ncbi:ccr4 associated factor [Geranomyces variabilis]|nr:ccr4 associated factor [Geranomyces variabilis]
MSGVFVRLRGGTHATKSTHFYAPLPALACRASIQGRWSLTGLKCSTGPRRTLHSSTTPTARTLASDYLCSINAKDQFTVLEGRGFLEVQGVEAIKFLQGLTTNQLTKVERGGDGVFAAFLTAQGRVLFDVFIYPKNRGETFPHPTFIIEHDARQTADILLHLKRYKLRAKLTVTDVSAQYQAFQIWGPSTTHLWGTYLPPQIGAAGGRTLPQGAQLPRERFCDIGCKDPRHADLGLRVVGEAGSLPPLPSTFAKVSSDDYKLRRILMGIPEGAEDFHSGVSLPLESNLDLMSGVDFRKGCYLGQELTIRTYHTGVTRKRIVPVQFLNKGDPVPSALTLDTSFSAPLPPPHSDIAVDPDTAAAAASSSSTATTTAQAKTRRRRAPASVGQVRSSIYNVGLALMRLDHFGTGDHAAATLVVAGGGGGGDGLIVQPFAPQWWPQAPAEESPHVA